MTSSRHAAAGNRNPECCWRLLESTNLDLAESWMIGDSRHDVEAGMSAGCRTVRLLEGGESSRGADLIASSLLAAVQKILEVQTGLAVKRVGLRPLL